MVSGEVSEAVLLEGLSKCQNGSLLLSRIVGKFNCELSLERNGVGQAGIPANQLASALPD